MDEEESKSVTVELECLGVVATPHDPHGEATRRTIKRYPEIIILGALITADISLGLGALGYFLSGPAGAIVGIGIGVIAAVALYLLLPDKKEKETVIEKF